MHNIFGRKTKSLGTSTIVRNNKGEVINSTNGYLLDIDRYLGAFHSINATRNYITLFHTMSELQFPIRAITDRILNAEFYLKEYDTDSIIWNNDQINKFLSKPNALDTFDDLITKFVSYYLICGQSFLYSALPDSLSGMKAERWKWCDNYHVLPADCVEMEYPFRAKIFSTLQKDEIIKDYRLISGMGNEVYTPDNILHLRDVNMMFDPDYLKGRSRLSSLDYPLSNLCAVYEARNVIYVKRGAIGAISSGKTDSAGTVALTKGEKKDLEEEFQKDYGLRGDKSQYILSNVPITFTRFNMSIEELQPFDETLADEVAIAGAYNIPACLIPRKDMSTYNNQDIAEKSLYNNTIIPLTNKILSQLNSFLGLHQNKGGMYLFADFSKIPCLQTNKKDNAETDSKNTSTALVQYKCGACTKNQMRIKMGCDPVDGEDFYIDDDPNKGIILNIKDINTNDNGNSK